MDKLAGELPTHLEDDTDPTCVVERAVSSDRLQRLSAADMPDSMMGCELVQSLN